MATWNIKKIVSLTSVCLSQSFTYNKITVNEEILFIQTVVELFINVI